MIPTDVGSGVEVGIDRAEVARAIAFARNASPDELTEFHASYRIPLDDPPHASLEIVTEFRRVVLAFEDARRRGDAGWGVEQAMSVLRNSGGRLSLVLQLSFDPRNTYRTLPGFELRLLMRPEEGGPAAVRPVDVRATPQYVEHQPAPPGTPILGGLFECTFDARDLDLRIPHVVAILENGSEVGRVPVDFARLR
jgi:hypothetical protein